MCAMHGYLLVANQAAEKNPRKQVRVLDQLGKEAAVRHLSECADELKRGTGKVITWHITHGQSSQVLEARMLDELA